MKKILYILVVGFLAAAVAFLVVDYQKGDAILNNAVQSKENVAKGDSLKDNKESIGLFESASQQIKDDASIKLRILYRKWYEVEKKYYQLMRAVEVELEEAVILEKKLEELKALVEDIEKGTEEVLSLKTLTPEEEWKAYNLMGCVKLWKTLFVQGPDEKEVSKRIQGLMNEAVNNFKKSINVIEEHSLAGAQTDIPRHNLELLIKKNEGQKKQSENDQGKEGEDEKEGKKALKKVMPILSSPGETGGEK